MASASTESICVLIPCLNEEHGIAGVVKDFRAAFREVLRHNPGDRLAQIYIDRCDHLQANPPAGEWDGVWVMKSK